MPGLKSPDAHIMFCLLLHTTSHQAFPLLDPSASRAGWPTTGGPRHCWHVSANSLDNQEEEFNIIFHVSTKLSLIFLP